MVATITRPMPKPWKAAYLDALSSLSPGVLAGLLCGALIGGLGGRLAMFLLRLTSSDSLHGLQTDDDFTIGSFTGATFFLVILTALAGVLGGLLYMGVRSWLPKPWRATLFGLFGATVGGTLVIRPDGIDFTALEPLSLAVALFVILPATYGAILSVVTERLLNVPRLQRGGWRWVAVLPLLLPALVTGPFGLGLLVISAAMVAMNRTGQVTRLWRSTPVTWAGRIAFAAAIVAGSFFLVRDVSLVL